MDEARSDFSCVSKLMLGWYTKDQIMVYDRNIGPTSYTLKNCESEEGNCLIIPVGDLDSNFKSEFFILEYFTLDGNNSNINDYFWWRNNGEGIRCFHVEATEFYDGWRTFFKYESGNNKFTNDDEGIRFIRLVNDGEKDNLFRTGNHINSAVRGFFMYNKEGVENQHVRVNIDILANNGDDYEVGIWPYFA